MNRVCVLCEREREREREIVENRGREGVTDVTWFR